MSGSLAGKYEVSPVPNTRPGTEGETTAPSCSFLDSIRQSFAVSNWSRDAIANLSITTSGLYGLILLVIYVAFAFTETVTFPHYQHILHNMGFFLYLDAVSIVFLCYVLFYVLLFQNRRKDGIALPNHKSHGSLTIRLGSVIFGIGLLIYCILSIIDMFDINPDSECFRPNVMASMFLTIIFVVLQTYLIVMYPRLNLNNLPNSLDRFGTSHLIASNVIFWIRTIIRESLLEIAEAEEELHKDPARIKRPFSNEEPECDPLWHTVELHVKQRNICDKERMGLLDEDILVKSSPYLFPLIIEYVLIGASVSFLMWKHVGCSSEVRSKLERPNPKEFVQKWNWSHSIKGLIAGIIFIVIAIANLVIFFHLNEDSADWVSKVINIGVNGLTIPILLFGIVDIQVLEHSSHEDHESDLDGFLLRLTAFFTYLYQMFNVITGAFSDKHEIGGHFHIANGIIEVIQITLQIIFIMELKQKKLPPLGTDLRVKKPGRQIATFLFFFNLAQWILVIFEIQKLKSSWVEATFFGFMPWILIQRITLPLVVFFRFHSAVLSIELWKEVYVQEIGVNKTTKTALL